MGHRYCWYDDGWRGPGWYWCDYAWRYGLGWGGGYGWRGWRWHGGRYWGGGGHGGGSHWGGGHGGGGHGVGGHGGGGGGHGGHRSDMRLKEDIVALGRLSNGIGVYRFRYKGHDRTPYVGVMAQEVERIAPDTVSRARDGYLRVHYDRLGLEFLTWDAWVARSGGKLRWAQ